MSDNPWHKLYAEEYELAEAEAAGALAGWTNARGEGFMWTAVFVEGFRAAAGAAFDHGFEAGRREYAGLPPVDGHPQESS